MRDKRWGIITYKDRNMYPLQGLDTSATEQPITETVIQSATFRLHIFTEVGELGGWKSLY